jgi:amidase
MGRTLEDVARLMDTQAGFDARQPLAITTSFDLAQALTPLNAHEISKLKILYWGDLCGYLAIEDDIERLCKVALEGASGMGCKVDVLESQSQLGFAPARVWDAWLVWRKALVGARLAPFMAMKDGRSQIKPEGLAEYDNAQNLTGEQFTAASVVRSSFYQAMLKLLESYDAIALPTAQVWPFDVTMRYPTEIKTKQGTRTMDTYHRWMEATIYATFAGLPCISVPVGFGTSGVGSGLAMGMQLIGKPQGDADLLRLASLIT